MAKVYDIYFQANWALPKAQKAEIQETDVVSYQAPSCATAVDRATFRARLAGGNYVHIAVGYNAKSKVFVNGSEGVQELWSYGDHHGMVWEYFGKITGFPVVLRLDVPGHHNHYRIPLKITIQADGAVRFEEDLADVPVV